MTHEPVPPLDPGRWERIKDVLLRALELPAAERAAFVAQECSGDSATEEEVHLLLHADSELESESPSSAFLETGLDDVAARLIATGSPSRAEPATAGELGREVPFSWGPLEVRARLGAGAFGEVFSAFDPLLQREVALKLRRMVGGPGAVLSQSEVRRVSSHLEEARRLARLRHRHVLAVHGAETHDGFAGIWTDLVRGETLDRLLELSGPFPRERIGRVGTELCRALAAVHGAGMVHGDVKTANAMVGADGRAILMDFGSGTESGTRLELGPTDSDGMDIVSVDPDATSGSPLPSLLERGPRLLVGTPVAMAPELFRGEAHTVASDLYALGVLLYRIATGRYPYRGRTMDELRRNLDAQNAVRLEEARPDLPAAFARVVHRALDPDPSRRPASANEFLWLLEASLGLSDVDRRTAGDGRPPDEFPGDSGEVEVSRFPVRRGRFIGRDKELGHLRSLLTAPGCVTITGARGCGKTRLAQQVAIEFAASMPFCADWLDLASLVEGGHVESEVARRLGIADDPRLPRLEQLGARLGGVSRLLVLDHVEDGRREVSKLVAALLAACPNLRVLATGRRVLGVSGERVVKLSPLSLPEDRAGTEGYEIVDADGVRLFIDRLQTSQHEFVLTVDAAPLVARIVRHLDATPLALEMAAAQAARLGLRELHALLGSTTASPRVGAPGRRTKSGAVARIMRCVLETLAEDAATCLLRLAVFEGGCRLEAAEAICGPAAAGDRPVLDLVEDLTDSALLALEAQGEPEARYRMPEAVREWALEELDARGELTRAREAHGSWFERAAAHWSSELAGPRESDALAFFDREHDNLTLAWRTALATVKGDDSAEPALALMNSLSAYWAHRGFHRLAIERIQQSLTCIASASTVTVGCLARLAHHQLALGHGSTAERNAQEAVRSARELCDRESLGAGLFALARAQERMGEPARARESLEECRLLAEGPLLRSVLVSLGDAALQTGEIDTAAAALREALARAPGEKDRVTHGEIQARLAEVAWRQGRTAEAQSLADHAARALRSAARPAGLAVALRVLVRLALARGDVPQARDVLLEGLARGAVPQSDAMLLSLLEMAAEVQLSSGDPRQAAELLGFLDGLRQSDAVSREVPAPRSGLPTLDTRGALEERVRAALGEEEYRHAWERGRMAERESILVRIAGGPS